MDRHFLLQGIFPIQESNPGFLHCGQTLYRSEVKSKGEKEIYKHLNAEFQRIATRDKKAFLSDQYKEIEEKNIMGKTRDLFKKIRDTKGTFHVKVGSIKDRNGMDLTEADDIKKLAKSSTFRKLRSWHLVPSLHGK